MSNIKYFLLLITYIINKLKVNNFHMEKIHFSAKEYSSNCLADTVVSAVTFFIFFLFIKMFSNSIIRSKF